MQCTSCKCENSVTSKFCSSCGNQLLTDGDIRSPSEITVNWLRDIFQSLGYEVRTDDFNETENTFFARHADKPNIFIELKRQISLITFLSSCRIKKHSCGQKSQHLSVVNKANTINWLCSCSLDKEMDGFNITGSMFITEKISNRDIASFLDTFSSGIDAVLNNSGVRELV